MIVVALGPPTMVDFIQGQKTESTLRPIWHSLHGKFHIAACFTENWKGYTAVLLNFSWKWILLEEKAKKTESAITLCVKISFKIGNVVCCKIARVMVLCDVGRAPTQSWPLSTGSGFCRLYKKSTWGVKLHKEQLLFETFSPKTRAYAMSILQKLIFALFNAAPPPLTKGGKVQDVAVNWLGYK